MRVERPVAERRHESSYSGTFSSEVTIAEPVLFEGVSSAGAPYRAKQSCLPHGSGREESLRCENTLSLVPKAPERPFSLSLIPLVARYICTEAYLGLSVLHRSYRLWNLVPWPQDKTSWTAQPQSRNRWRSYNTSLVACHV